MTMQKYISRKIVIEAMQYAPNSPEELPEGVIEEWTEPETQTGHCHCYIDTLEGRMTVSPGDFIIRGTKGELYPCKPDIFKHKYEEVADGRMVERVLASSDPDGQVSAPELPTPGRIVYLYDRIEDPDREEPIPAGVVGVSENGGVNRLVVEIWGENPPFRTAHVLHIDTPDNDTGESDYTMGWDWMPYQKGQAKKLEEVQAIDWPGLRTMPSLAEFDNRFTYHAPTPEQVDKYQQIRAKAKDLACQLCAFCPPSAELAAALDALDTTVFKANAAIARHS